MNKLLSLFLTLGLLASGCTQTKGPSQSEDEKLGNFTLLLMDITHADLSPMRRQILARTLVRVTGEIFTEYAHREAFIGLISHESRFSSTAKSPAGATGIAQLMPAYAKHFAKLCGLSDFSPADLQDVELNLTLGACFYKDLLEKLNGNTIAAETAYNGGEYSESLKSLLAQRQIKNTETSNYAIAISYKKEEANTALKQIEMAQSQEVKETPVDIVIEDIKATRIKSLIKISFQVRNTEDKTSATGAVVAIGTIRTADGKTLYISSPPAIGPAAESVNIAEALKKALPFSIKKFNTYEVSLSVPKEVKGNITEIKLVALDTRTNGQTTSNVNVPD